MYFSYKNSQGGKQMPLTKLATLLKDMDLYISQHAIYINKMEKAIKNKEPFEHKDCRHCNFG
ncbi:MAG: hypothetical protein ACP5P0_06580, partial [Hydrogenobacter sp.]